MTSSSTPRTVLIVGGTGSIGRVVVARLAELGRTSRVLTTWPSVDLTDDESNKRTPHDSKRNPTT